MFKHRKTAYLALVAALAAVSIICNAWLKIATPVNGVAITFSYIPCLVAGALLGPLAGLTVGFVGDLLGNLIKPLGPYNPIIGVSAALLGFIPGFIFKELKLKRIKPWIADSAKICISFALNFIICTASLNTYALYVMYGSKSANFWAYFATRVPWQSLMVAVNLVLCLGLYPLIKQAYEKVFKPKAAPASETETGILPVPNTEDDNIT